MDKIKVFELELMPLYNNMGVLLQESKEIIISSYSPIIIKDILDKEEDDYSPWDKEEQGRSGELIAKKYLENKYKEVVDVSKTTKLGYDIKVNDKLAFEVKTSKSKNFFHISYNELKVATYMQDKYNLFFIKVDVKDEKITKATGFIINNPIKILQINLRIIAPTFELDNINLKPSQFKIYFNKDFISLQEWIILTDYIS